jgi:hypothetical protein
MTPHWADMVQAASSVLALVAAIAGFLSLRHQIKQVERGIRGETHSGLYQHNFEVMRFIGENAPVRPYFYDGKELGKGDANYDLIMTAAGIMASLFEHVALQRPNLPDDVWESWVRHIKSMYAMSPALRQYFSEHRCWYSADMLMLLKDADAGSACNKASA